jgi:hypothetical protein
MYCRHNHKTRKEHVSIKTKQNFQIHFYKSYILHLIITPFDQNGPLYSSININWPLYVAMSKSGKSLGIDC